MVKNLIRYGIAVIVAFLISWTFGSIVGWIRGREVPHLFYGIWMAIIVCVIHIRFFRKG